MLQPAASADEETVEVARSGEETIQVMRNACFGGFHFSDRARKAYCDLKGLDVSREGRRLEWTLSRTDRDMTAIVRALDGVASDALSNICLVTIPKKFEAHFKICEYDGWESVDIDYKGYKLARIQEALAEGDEGLAARIAEILAEPEESGEDAEFFCK